MPDPLTIAAVQPPCVEYDVGQNAHAHAVAIHSAGARVVVFPELSLTGYELDAPALALDDARLEPLVEASKETGALALAGAPVRGEDGDDHIAMLAVDNGQAGVAYRKMWLGDAEAERFAPGEQPVVVEVDGWRLGLAICKDTGVAEHAAATAALGIDAYVAGVLEHADDAHVAEERALRVVADHRVWVAIASFAGSTGGGYGAAAGGSAIWSPDGVRVSNAAVEPGAVARATLV